MLSGRASRTSASAQRSGTTSSRAPEDATYLPFVEDCIDVAATLIRAQRLSAGLLGLNDLLLRFDEGIEYLLKRLQRLEQCGVALVVECAAALPRMLSAVSTRQGALADPNTS